MSNKGCIEIPNKKDNQPFAVMNAIMVFLDSSSVIASEKSLAIWGGSLMLI